MDLNYKDLEEVQLGFYTANTLLDEELIFLNFHFDEKEQDWELVLLEQVINEEGESELLQLDGLFEVKDHFLYSFTSSLNEKGESPLVRNLS